MKRDWRIYLVVGVVLAVAGGVFALLAPRSHRPPSLPRSAPSAAPSVSSLGAPPKVAAAIPRSVPIEIKIPSINVDAKVIPEGTDSSGALETPPLTEQNVTGWWDGGNTPGQDGPAVIVGHIDSAALGPMVFWNLHDLVAGQAVDVVLADGAQVWFNVVGSQQVSKDAFPTQQVYGPTAGPTLRLITCTGDFNPATGHYDDNLIVYLNESVPSG
jgi:sortase (surface protein transpeptidase)